MFLELLTHADSVIFNIKPENGLSISNGTDLAGFEPYSSALGRIFDGVGCQIDQHFIGMKLISIYIWIGNMAQFRPEINDFSRLSDVREVISGILSDENARDYMDENRINVIAELTEHRIRNVQMLAQSKTRVRRITTEDDVTEDVAENYVGSVEK